MSAGERRVSGTRSFEDGVGLEGREEQREGSEGVNVR